jgi:hypothetical protein
VIVSAEGNKPMPRFGAIAWLVPLVVWISGAAAADFHIDEVPAIESTDRLQPHDIEFADHRGGAVPDPGTGLVSFESWAREMPIQKHFLSPYPDYVEPTENVVVDGVTKPVKESLYMYLAQARFGAAKSPESIDLAHFATLAFLEHIDPAIKHQLISAADVESSIKESSIKNPARPWCEAGQNVICIQSRYQFEGKLPTAIHLVNQLTEKKKIPDYLEFQSELRALAPADLDVPGLTKLTGIDAPIVCVFEQNIFQINQVLKFGKFLAVIQRDPADANRTIATAYIALAVKARIIENKKKYENVPVLRNLVPAQVLVGKSSFNSGSSISAGLPLYTRNKIKAVADFFEQE